MNRENVKTMVESKAFQAFVFAVIAVNAITIGIETSPPSEQAADLLEAFDYVCLGIYMVEAALKMYAYQGDYFKDGWNVFDFAIILLSLMPFRLMPMPVQFVRIVRLLRVVRVFRIISMFDRLRIIVESIARSIPGVLWTLLLLVIIVYAFDVAGVFLFSERCPVQFGNLSSGLWSLFQVLTLEGWPDIAHATMSEYPHSWLFFVPFVILTSFIMVNIVIGIIVDAVEESSQIKRIDAVTPQAQLAEELAELRAQIETVQYLLDKYEGE